MSVVQKWVTVCLVGFFSAPAAHISADLFHWVGFYWVEPINAMAGFLGGATYIALTIQIPPKPT